MFALLDRGNYRSDYIEFLKFHTQCFMTKRDSPGPYFSIITPNNLENDAWVYNLQTPCKFYVINVLNKR